MKALSLKLAILLLVSLVFTLNTMAVEPPTSSVNRCVTWLARGLGISKGATSSRLKLAKELITLRDDEIPLRIVQEYPDVMALTGDVDASPFGITMAHPEKPLASEKLFGKSAPEFDRTIAGILVLKWILAGNYEKLISVQKPEVKLTRETFNKIQAYVKRVLPNEQAVDAMITSMVINDLGKIKAFVEKTKRETGIEDVDHDNILLAALKKNPTVSPAYVKLLPKFQQIIMRGLEAKFNLGQFVQSENVAASLDGMKSLVNDQQSLDFYLIHALVDIAGVGGHKTQEGSLLLTEPLAQSFNTGIEALKGLAKGRSTKQVYEDFVAAKGRIFALNPSDRLERTAIRLSTMLGYSRPGDAREVVEALRSLQPNTLAVLLAEMNLSGVDDGTATLIYYAPAIVSNVRAAIEKSGGHLREALNIGFTTLARIYQKARTRQVGESRSGVYTVFAKDAADTAGLDPRSFEKKDFELEKVGDGAKLVMSDLKPIVAEEFGKLSRLSDIPGQKIGVIGIGGGSDGVQAALLAQLLAKNNKQVPFVISVRTAKTASQSATGEVGEDRTVVNHGGEIFPGVFIVLPHSSGKGRFLENLPASDLPMFIVIDRQDGALPNQIKAVCEHVKGIDRIIAVDTGGDALYPTTNVENSRATPDQDLRVLNALTQLDFHVPIMTAIIAAEVDSPANAQSILAAAKAMYYQPTADDALHILSKYKTWHMDGTSDSRFGKTALAWQYALTNQIGLQALPIPARNVTDRKNPWDPFVSIAPSMKDIFFMDLGLHLKALGVAVQKTRVVLSDRQYSQLAAMTYVNEVENLLIYNLKWPHQRAGQFIVITHPSDETQKFVYKATPPGMSFASVTPEEAAAFVSALKDGNGFVFHSARDLFEKSNKISGEELTKLKAEPWKFRRMLVQEKGWTDDVIKTGLTYEYGDAWYQAPWVHKFTSPDGKVSLTEAIDFDEVSPAELEAYQRAINSGITLVTKRAEAALDPSQTHIPGENPRSKPPR